VNLVIIFELTTGITFFVECLRHSTKPFYTRQTVYRQRVLCRVLFIGHWAKTLPSVEKLSAKKSNWQIKNRKNPKKQQNILKIMWTTLEPLPITIPITLSFFTIILNQIYMFCEWWDSNSHPLSHAYLPLPLHYYINYVYIMFSFLMYYNKPRVIWLFEALNEFIWKCDQL
jgi:hypothetical protein